MKLIRKNGIRDDVHINKSFPWLDTGRPIESEYIIQPSGFKSHFPYNHFLMALHVTPLASIFT